jgi:hypothetical protein
VYILCGPKFKHDVLCLFQLQTCTFQDLTLLHCMPCLASQTHTIYMPHRPTLDYLETLSPCFFANAEAFNWYISVDTIHLNSHFSYICKDLLFQNISLSGNEKLSDYHCFKFLLQSALQLTLIPIFYQQCDFWFLLLLELFSVLLTARDHKHMLLILMFSRKHTQYLTYCTVNTQFNRLLSTDTSSSLNLNVYMMMHRIYDHLYV